MPQANAYNPYGFPGYPGATPGMPQPAAPGAAGTGAPGAPGADATAAQGQQGQWGADPNSYYANYWGGKSLYLNPQYKCLRSVRRILWSTSGWRAGRWYSTVLNVFPFRFLVV